VILSKYGLLKKGNEWAIDRIIIEFTYNTYNTDNSDVHFIDELKTFIEELKQMQHPTGYYLKAIGMKNGAFGFIKDLEKAKAYIFEHVVPY
jgi:hypothetical protein